ncbi:CDP-diacylglycerol--glycerol-3-phosphate 3-phosphatidyltransferase [Helicobacter monodelphidis]|uniref:CDP-diacylglycerol--glycerol-3-phosphate 3-phosphatidyltransferase n=1 Tax=Helicobacter sp. 15-1451 TaxID=2004995 RepID=UPI0015ECCDCD|nr:CDP-diacylglycerol--glycerol-3-phosphate 3-phosphatidyltransferase [Helicobacter sp. 15-1451]
MRNIPNILTFSRIVFSFLLLGVVLYGEFLLPPPIHPSWRDYFACLIFILASITDFFDGFIAREHQITTTFGEVFDPLADKMLILSAFLALLILKRADVWAIFLILSREFFITGLRVVAISKGISVAASNLGKYKTTLQIGAIGFLLMEYMQIGTVLLWLAVLVTLYSGYDYLKRYWGYTQ